jgi:O-acetylhomoserine (thiol)-lyase
VQKYMGGKASGILNFGVKGGREAGGRFQDALQLVTRLVNIGDCKTLACHPAIDHAPPARRRRNWPRPASPKT